MKGDGVLGNNIRVIRKSAGESQGIFAKRLGLSQSNIGKIERSERSVTISTLRAIAKELGTTASALLDENNNAAPDKAATSMKNASALQSAPPPALVNTPTTVRVFMSKGNLQGIAVAGLAHWTGSITWVPIDCLHEMEKRPQSRQAGIRLVLGKKFNTNAIGIAGGAASVLDGVVEDMRDTSVDDVKRVILITDDEATLTANQFSWIAHKMYMIAVRNAGANQFDGSGPLDVTLDETQTAEAESFLNNIIRALPVFQVSAFGN